MYSWRLQQLFPTSYKSQCLVLASCHVSGVFKLLSCLSTTRTFITWDNSSHGFIKIVHATCENTFLSQNQLFVFFPLPLIISKTHQMYPVTTNPLMLPLGFKCRDTRWLRQLSGVHHAVALLPCVYEPAARWAHTGGRRTTTSVSEIVFPAESASATGQSGEWVGGWASL